MAGLPLSTLEPEAELDSAWADEADRRWAAHESSGAGTLDALDALDAVEEVRRELSRGKYA